MPIKVAKKKATTETGKGRHLSEDASNTFILSRFHEIFVAAQSKSPKQKSVAMINIIPGKNVRKKSDTFTATSRLCHSSLGWEDLKRGTFHKAKSGLMVEGIRITIGVLSEFSIFHCCDHIKKKKVLLEFPW